MQTLRIGLAVAFLALGVVACSAGAPKPSTASSQRRAGPVELTYLGAAGWQLRAGPRVLLVDPYFSGAPVDDEALPLSPNAALIAEYSPPRADAVLVSHSHYDHLLDVPDVAKRTGAPIVGTSSTLNVARAAGLPEGQLVLARVGETRAFGHFSVHALRGLHSPTGQSNAQIPPGVTLPMSASVYAEGDTLQFVVRVEARTVLFISSANFIESELDGVRPDVAVVAVALREKIPNYSCTLMRVLGNPALVLANHFDAHWEPLGAAQLAISPEARKSLAQFAAEVHACAPATRVVVPTHFRGISI